MLKESNLRVCAVMLLLFLLYADLNNAICQLKSDQPEFTLNSLLVVGELTQEKALPTILKIGLKNKLPLGIIAADSRLCKVELPGSSEANMTVEEMIEIIRKDVPGYDAVLDHGVLVVAPITMPDGNTHLLQLSIPKFTVVNDTQAGMSDHLFTFIRALLVPSQGTAFAGPVNLDDQPVTGFTVREETVQRILERIVSRGMGGVWLMSKIDPNWRNNPSTMPYTIDSYTKSNRTLNVGTCPLSP